MMTPAEIALLERVEKLEATLAHIFHEHLAGSLLGCMDHSCQSLVRGYE